MRAELVFIPAPAMGHLVSAVETAKLLVGSDDRISITVLIIPTVSRTSVLMSYVQSLCGATSHDRLRYSTLPHPNMETRPLSMTAYIETQKLQVREAIAKLYESTRADSSPRLAGFVIDMFCVPLIDVANELGLPTYMFYTCSAGFLGLQFHVQFLTDEKNYDVTELKDSDAELTVPSLTHPFPAKCFPSVMQNKEWIQTFVGEARRFRETRGILVNTFTELESYALTSLSEDGKVPRVFPVGPVLNLKTEVHDSRGGPDGDQKRSEILRWLDDQPPRSVVFLCFGSVGGFDEDQAREIARGLERSGHRFLWSLRRAAPRDTMSPPGDFENLEEVLPKGFLDRTSEIGKIIGWSPQVAVLDHPAVGGFVSHCGWNSTLESLWFGVPMAAWPLYAEQQFNAFEMVVELGLAVEIKMDYSNGYLTEKVETVTAEQIERGIRCLMEHDNEVRERAQGMSKKARAALMDGGSSHAALGRFIQEVLVNIL